MECDRHIGGDQGWIHLYITVEGRVVDTRIAWLGSRIFSAGPGDIYRRQKAAMEEEEVAQR